MTPARDVFNYEYEYMDSGLVVCKTCACVVPYNKIDVHGGFHENQRLIYVRGND